MDTVNGATPEQAALMDAYSGPGGIASARRIISQASRENLPKVIQLQTSDAVNLARRCGVPDVDVYDAIMEAVLDRNDMAADELQAIFVKILDDGIGLEQKPNGAARIDPPIDGSMATFSAAELQHMTFPPLKFILPGLVPEGATLVVSRPKLGKSWMVLDIALAVAGERFTLGELKPSPGAVLYLALEDGRRRLQRRITRLLPTFGATWPERLSLATEWPRADQGGLDRIEKWIKSAEAPRLIIIDTLAQFRAQTSNKTQMYADDYAAVASLQKLASKYSIAIIIVHHDRKSEADDVFDTVSGTLGLTGAADTILILKRQAGSVTMHVRGRDIEESEKALQFSKDTCRWAILGEAADVCRSNERQAILSVLGTQPMGPREVADAIDGSSYEAVRKTLQRMANDGDIEKSGHGSYTLSQVSQCPNGEKQPEITTT